MALDEIPWIAKSTSAWIKSSTTCVVQTFDTMAQGSLSVPLALLEIIS